MFRRNRRQGENITWWEAQTLFEYFGMILLTILLVPVFFCCIPLCCPNFDRQLASGCVPEDLVEEHVDLIEEQINIDYGALQQEDAEVIEHPPGYQYVGFEQV